MYKPIRSAELVSGGNVVKQGEYFTLTYQLFDEDGQVVNITSNTIKVKIANKYGVVFESTAIALANGQISFAVNEDIGYGEMRIEFSVTNGTTLVQKYPSDGWIKLDVTPSLDDLGIGGINTVTVASLKREFQTQLDAVVQRETDSDAMSRQAAVNAKGVDEVNLKSRLDNEYNEVTAQLSDKVNEEDVFLKRSGININDLDDPTRKVFLEAQGINVNYVLGAGNVKPINTSFFKTGKNLFDKNATKLGYYVNQLTGELNANVDHVASDYILVKQNTSYALSFIGSSVRVAFYDANKTFISGISPVSVNPINTPNGTRYIRVSFNKLSVDTQQVEEGNTATPYETYHEYIPKSIVEKGISDISEIPVIPVEKLDFINSPSNLYNKSKISIDRYVNNTNGNLTSSNGFVASDYTPVSGNKDYVVKVARHIAFYDKSKSFISGANIDGNNKNNYQFKTPSNCAFVRFSWYPLTDNVPINIQQMNDGMVLMPMGIPKSLIIQDKREMAILPPKIYGVVGKEINIYFENILNVPLKDIEIDVVCSIGKQLSNKWTTTPTGTGTYDLTISLFKDFDLIYQEKTSIIVKSGSVGNGINKKALIIGDSTINQKWILEHTNAHLSNDPLTISFVGTRGVAPNTHEGRGGWTASLYRTNTIYDGSGNPFYNPTKSDFDFSHYMTAQGYSSLDYVGICLGINDVFSFTSDAQLLNATPSILSNMDVMINSIRAFSSTIKVGVFVTIPPNASQDTFGDTYGNGQTQWRYKRNNALWIKELINKYGNKESEGIYLIPENNNIDAQNGFRDGVHPNQEIGDKQRGDNLYYWFKSFES